VLFAVFGAFPLVYTGWVSLHDWHLIGEHTFVWFDNYTALFSDPDFWNALKNTVGIFVLATVPQLVMALAMANLLNRKIRARTFFRMGVLIPNVTSVAAVGIVFGQLFARDVGLVNYVITSLGLDAVDWQANTWSSWIAIATMVDWRWIGYNSLIYLAAMQSIPRDIYESAALDGASQSKQFWRITVPMLRPTIIFTVIISTIGGLQLYAEPLLFNGGASAFLGGSMRQSQTVTMYLMEQFYGRFQFGDMATVAWLLFLLILVFSVINYAITSRIESSGKRGGAK